MSTDTTVVHDDTDTEPDRRSSLRRQLPALLVLGGVALLLIGVGLGLLVGRTVDSSTGSDATPASNSAAVGFAQDMSTHHSQGVEMATIALSKGSDPQVRSLAYDILTQQTNQIGQMQSWLTRWGYPLDNPSTAMDWMSDHHDMSGGSMGASMSMTAGNGTTTPLMPGMATASEMNRLRTMSGTELDAYFLQLMLRHHQGGLPMMEYASDPDHVSQDYVRTLAQQMINTQENEAQTMTAMLTERGVAPLSMN
ncbi:hypothetical protein ASG12_14685 [Williamsia sp. Leaf354]|uniref:DUF305 domain-containing protein n=1 Tax=Williamsia sp. Leaf354 TaxID=1736349 RepID=UPI0006F2C873|nr:DUF305 domain-containing protein [Williamsia sp. Leaf354]KQR97220.1 hypothetical protein ASG12_14685 [Williamsia sp. Leaf354]